MSAKSKLGAAIWSGLKKAGPFLLAMVPEGIETLREHRANKRAAAALPAGASTTTTTSTPVPALSALAQMRANRRLHIIILTTIFLGLVWMNWSEVKTWPGWAWSGTKEKATKLYVWATGSSRGQAQINIAGAGTTTLPTGGDAEVTPAPTPSVAPQPPQQPPQVAGTHPNRSTELSAIWTRLDELSGVARDLYAGQLKKEDVEALRAQLAEVTKLRAALTAQEVRLNQLANRPTPSPAMPGQPVVAGLSKAEVQQMIDTSLSGAEGRIIAGVRGLIPTPPPVAAAPPPPAGPAATPTRARTALQAPPVPAATDPAADLPMEEVPGVRQRVAPSKYNPSMVGRRWKLPGKDGGGDYIVQAGDSIMASLGSKKFGKPIWILTTGGAVIPFNGWNSERSEPQVNFQLWLDESEAVVATTK